MAALQVLRLLLLSDQLSTDELQELLADDTGARLLARLCQTALHGGDRSLAPTVAELRAAVLQLAKQGYLDHSRGIRLSRLGGTARSSQPVSKQAACSATGCAPPSPSAFPALPSIARPPPPATPTAATPTSSWATSLAAAAAGPTPTTGAAVPSPAGGGASAAPTPNGGGGGGGGKLQGAWAQGPLASMSNKKQAALDERLRGRTPPVPSVPSAPSQPGGAWAAGSPSASVGSAGSAQTGAGGGRGRGRQQQQQQQQQNVTPSSAPGPGLGLGHGHGPAGQDVSNAAASVGAGGGAGGCRGNGLAAVANGRATGSAAFGASPGGGAAAAAAANGHQHPHPPRPGAGPQPVQAAQGGVKRIAPMPIQQHQQPSQQAAAAAASGGVWPSPSCAEPPASSAASPVGSGLGVGGSNAGAMNIWGVPPVNTSKQQQQQQRQQAVQQRQQQQAAAVAAAVKEPSAGGGGAAAAAVADDAAAEPDPVTPCSAVVTSNVGGGPDGLTTPTCCSSLAATANGQANNDPITPAGQIVPAVSDGALSAHGSAAVAGAAASGAAAAGRYGARYGISPPSVTSYPQGRPPVAPPGPVDANGRCPALAQESLAHGCVDMAAAGPARGGSASSSGSSALGPVWGPPHERLAQLHAWVLCCGAVACMQDEVAELLYLLACPPEVLLVAEADAGDAAVATKASAAAAAVAAAAAAGAGARPRGGESLLDWPLHVAVQYGCAVLSRCGGLLSGLGHRLLAAVATCAAARLAAPALATAADAAAQRRERSLARSRAVDALGGQRLLLVGPMLQSGNDMASGKSRSQEQQRRVSNRERCRDMFFAVVRQAAPLINRGADGGALSDHHVPAAAGASTPGGGRGSAAAGHTPPPSTPGGLGAGLGGAVSVAAAESLAPLRSQCLEVLHSLHPDNLPFFAELFTGCVLQAAATGESLVEGDLASLASRNPSKFQRLNQRMQQAPGQVLAQLTPSHQQHHQQQQSTPSQSGGRTARTPGGYADGGFGGGGGGRGGGSGNTPGHHSGTPGYGGGLGHRGGGSAGGGLMAAYGSGASGAYGSMAGGGGSATAAATQDGGGGGGGPSQRDSYGVAARCAATLQRLSYFPPPQRPYIFFLEATDSQSLVAAVSRHMAGVLQSMLCKALGASPATASTAAAAMHGPANGSGGNGGIGPSPAAAVGPLGDHVVATGTLASYLAYLSVVHGAVRYSVSLPAPSCSRGAAAAAAAAAVRLPRHPPLDVLQLLCVAEERGVLVHVVPCIAQYLYIITNGPRITAGADGLIADSDATAGGGAGGAVLDVAAAQLPYLQAVAARLRLLLGSRALQPQQPAFCAAALCLRSAAEEALSHAAAVIAAAAAAASATDDCDAAAALDDGASSSLPWPPSTGDVSEHGAEGGAARGGGGGGGGDASDRDARLARSLQESDGLVDSRLLELCCPAIEAASRVLQRAAGAAAKILQQHGGRGGGGGGGGAAGAAAAAAAVGSPGSAGTEPRPLMPRRVPPAPLVRLGGGAAGSGGGGGAAAAEIPESVAAVLAAPGPSPLQQALTQALLGQYSTGEHAVPMRDVVSYVTGVLAVNGAAAALELIVPQVASEHLGRLAEALRPVLGKRVRRWQEDAATAAAMAAAALGAADGVGGGDTPLASAAAAVPPPALPISEAVAAAVPLAAAATAAATAASLEAALPAVRRQLRENALRSLQALLPGTVPEEAVAAAAVLAAQSAEVACLQRLVAHVPPAVRGHMDEQVKHVVREVVREVERQAAEARMTVLVGPVAEAEAVAAEAEVKLESSHGDEVGSGAATAASGGGGGVVMDGAVAEARKQEDDGGPCQGECEGETAATAAVGSGAAASVKVVAAGLAAAATAAAKAAAEFPAAATNAAAADDAGCEAPPPAGGEKAAAAAVGAGGGEDVDGAIDTEAAAAGMRLSDILMELARRAADPPLDEVVQCTAQCVGRVVTLRPATTASTSETFASDGGGRGPTDWSKCSAAVAAAAAGRRLYDAIRGGELDAASLERLLVRCLRAACATATAGGAAATAWGARPPPPPVAAAIAAAAEADAGAAAFAFLAEVCLCVVQSNADDAHTWADAVWRPPPLYDDDDDDDGSCSDTEPPSSGSAAAVAAASLPPMLANLYHHLAAYSRDVESYRLLHGLRRALQRVTMGHLARIDAAEA